MSFNLPQLSYEMDALEPYISRETVEYHYGKHQKGYVDTLNRLIANTEYENKSLIDIIRAVPSGPLFNNAAQAWTHAFYWESLLPAKDFAEPNEEMLEIIDSRFNSFDEFKATFSQTAVGNFGSGWTWLVKTENGGIEIVNTSNAGTPLTTNMKPLLTCDVWEHAYYIDYRNRRADYLDGFWHLVNWQKVFDRFKV